MLSEELRNFVQTNFNFRSTLFWRHQDQQLEKFQSLFDTIESQPPTELQRRAVILDERRNLVVAGAGSGKTSVIIAKAAYLIESGVCQPEDVLLLAFNADAAKELLSCLHEHNSIKHQPFVF
ncbi:MAG: UvrD-helicase domain-containing protein [Hyphomonadaceae bacterium]|nr:UvrD-helicase domain-containing protein [Hyphomonadaceae bacterium]